jgi:hypothetical protein
MNDDGSVVKVSLEEHSLWMKTNNDKRQIALDTYKDVMVSTVFLGMDHGYNSDKPILFETMIFGGEHDEYQERYATYEEALAGHKRAMEII